MTSTPRIDDSLLDTTIPSDQCQNLTLRHATPAVLLALVTERTEQAVAAAVAANQLARHVSVVLAAMEAQGADSIGELSSPDETKTGGIR